MAPTENGKTILLAEDEQPVRSFVLAMLQKAGYNVIVAVDGRDGLEKSRQFKDTIHILLSDVQMPYMTPIELATQLQIDRPDIRVLLISAMVSGLLLLNDGWQFLPKPFMSNLLKERISHLLLERSAGVESGGNPGEEAGPANGHTSHPTDGGQCTPSLSWQAARPYTASERNRRSAFPRTALRLLRHQIRCKRPPAHRA
jgi:DNA-binding response OmpR family regulator